jgi:hypothetical protein
MRRYIRLPVAASLVEYEALIIRVVSIPNAKVFAYRWGESPYPTIVAEVEESGGS